MLHAFLIHTADVKRPPHAVASRKKATGPLATVGTDLECFIQPIGDSPAFSLLGRTVQESYRITFQPDADVRVGDQIVWKDRTPNWTFIVEGDQDIQTTFDEASPHHLQITAQRSRAAG